MHYGTLALLNQSLRLDSRRLSTHLFFLLFVGLIFWMTLFASSSMAVLGAAGLQLFKSITWINFVFILLAGLGYFSSALADEKEEGALDLMKLVGVSPVILLLGRSTSQLLLALLVLAIQLPFTLLAITLGGVTLGQILAAYLSLAAFTVLIANAGLFWSAVTRTSAAASSGMVFFYLMYGMGIGLLADFVHNPMNTPQSTGGFYGGVWALARLLVDESITAQLVKILSTGYSGNLITPQIVLHLLVAFMFFVSSCYLFERVIKSASSAKDQTQRFHLFRRQKNRQPGMYGRVWKKSIVWKEFHFHCGGKKRLVLKLSLYTALFLLVVFAASQSGERITREGLGTLLVIGGFILFGLELFFHAHSMFSVEVRNRTWPDLVLTSASIGSIARQKILGCLLFSLPTLLFALVGVLLAPDFVSENLLSEASIWLGMGVVVFFLFSLLPLVTYISLEMKKSSALLHILLLFVALTCFGWILLIISLCSIPLVGSKLEKLAAE